MIHFAIVFVTFLNIFALCEFHNIKKYFRDLKHRDFLLSDAFIVLGTIPMLPMLAFISIIIIFFHFIALIVDKFFEIGDIVLFKRKK
jgi:hypothetical protein